MMERPLDIDGTGGKTRGHGPMESHGDAQKAPWVALSPDYETSSSLIGGVHSLLESAGGSCRDIKRAESAESADPQSYSYNF